MKSVNDECPQKSNITQVETLNDNPLYFQHVSLHELDLRFPFYKRK